MVRLISEGLVREPVQRLPRVGDPQGRHVGACLPHRAFGDTPSPQRAIARPYEAPRAGNPVEGTLLGHAFWFPLMLQSVT